MLRPDPLVKQRWMMVCHDLRHHHYQHNNWKEGREVVDDLDGDNRVSKTVSRETQAIEHRSTHGSIDPGIDIASIDVVEHQSNYISISQSYHHMIARSAHPKSNKRPYSSSSRCVGCFEKRVREQGARREGPCR